MRHISSTVTSCVAIALVLVALCSVADARVKMEEVWGEATGDKNPYRGVYEVRGEGFVHNVGNIRMNITNLGVLGNPWKNLSPDPSAQFPPGSGVEYLYAAGIWVGAKIGADPNPRVSTAIYETELRPSLLPVDTIYESQEGYPNGLRFFNDDGDYDPWGGALVDEEVHDGKDNDGDGLIDEDFAAISHQMFTCVYRDDTPEARYTYPGHVPMGLEITQRSFAWGIPGCDQFIGAEFTIKNDGPHDLHDLYLGFLCDGDAGPENEPIYWRDDRAGLVTHDTTIAGAGGDCPERLRLTIGETHDGDGDGGRTEGWFGLMFLGHSTDPRGIFAPPTVGITSFRLVSGGAPYERCGDPANDFQRYDFLSSNQIGCPPGFVTADSDHDYRIFFGTGPFGELPRGEQLTLQVAFVVGTGRQGMIESATAAQRTFNGSYRDLDGDPGTGVDGKETCLTAEPGEPWVFDYVYHCGLPDTLREYPEFWPVRITEPTCDLRPVQWADFDCDPCTGVDGRETLVSWVPTGCSGEVLEATVDFDPNTLNLKSKGKYVTCYIELPEGYDPNDIDVSTVEMNDVFPAEPSPVAVGDHDSDGISDLMVKFSRNRLISLLGEMDRPGLWVGRGRGGVPHIEHGDEFEVRISGEVAGGTAFSGTDIIRVIKPGRKHDKSVPLEVFPTPVKKGARISYELTTAGPMSLGIYDAAGRLVRTLETGRKPAGRYTVTWDRRTDDGAPAGAGVYFVRLDRWGEVNVRKLLMVD